MDKLGKSLSTFIFSITTTLSAAYAMQPMPQVKFQGAPVWVNDYKFSVDCRVNQTDNDVVNLEFECKDKKPQQYVLTHGGKFPHLDLKDPTSCHDFYQRLETYTSQLSILRRKYVYEAFYGDYRLSCNKMPPNQLPLRCILDSFCLRVNYDFKRLEVELFLIKFEEGDTHIFLDATSKLNERVGTIPLERFKCEGDANLEQMVSVSRDFSGCVFHAVGSIETCKIPEIPGIIGFEAPQEKRINTYRKGPAPYEGAIASRIIPRQSEEWTINVTEKDQEIGYVSEEISSYTETSSMLNSFEDINEETLFNPYQCLKVIGHERISQSPYVVKNDKGFFLTQSFEQDCFVMINGEVDPSTTYTLQYTMSTSYPIQIKGFEMTRPTGLYQLEGSSWMFVNSFYEPEDIFPAHRIGTQGFLTLKIMSQEATCDLKRTLQNSPSLRDYSELTGSNSFQQLLRSFQRSTTGLMQTIISLPPHAQHLIVPLLFEIRNFDHLRDDKLIHGDSIKLSDDVYSKPSAWRYHSGSPSKWVNFHRWVEQEHHFYPFTADSMKLLPLISGTKIDWGRGRLTMALGQHNSAEKKMFPFGIDADFYQTMANFIGTDEFIEFGFNYQGEHELDRELIIQAFARIFRHLTKLKTFHIPNYIGIKNLEYLIDHGLSINRSITNLSWYYMYGDYPMALMGRLLAKNNFLEMLSVCAYVSHMTDFECLNELGRGLEKNKSLKSLYLQFEIDGSRPSTNLDAYTDWIVNPFPTQPVIRPLPGRPRGSHPLEFNSFVKGVMESNIEEINIRINLRYGPMPPSFAAFRMAINEINKPTLKKVIYSNI